MRLNLSARALKCTTTPQHKHYHPIYSVVGFLKSFTALTLGVVRLYSTLGDISIKSKKRDFIFFYPWFNFFIPSVSNRRRLTCLTNLSLKWHFCLGIIKLFGYFTHKYCEYSNRVFPNHTKVGFSIRVFHSLCQFGYFTSM